MIYRNITDTDELSEHTNINVKIRDLMLFIAIFSLLCPLYIHVLRLTHITFDMDASLNKRRPIISLTVLAYSCGVAQMFVKNY